MSWETPIVMFGIFLVTIGGVYLFFRAVFTAYYNAKRDFEREENNEKKSRK